jgi:hypothetical protein
MLSSGQLWGRHANPASFGSGSGPTFTAGWHTLVRVWDGQRVRQYLDGLRTNTVVVTASRSWTIYMWGWQFSGIMCSMRCTYPSSARPWSRAEAPIRWDALRRRMRCSCHRVTAAPPTVARRPSVLHTPQRRRRHTGSTPRILQVARSCTLDKSSGLFLDTEQVFSNCCKTAQQDRLSIGVVLRTRPHKTDSAQTGHSAAVRPL